MIRREYIEFTILLWGQARFGNISVVYFVIVTSYVTTLIYLYLYKYWLQCNTLYITSNSLMSTF